MNVSNAVIICSKTVHRTLIIKLYSVIYARLYNVNRTSFRGMADCLVDFYIYVVVIFEKIFNWYEEFYYYP